MSLQTNPLYEKVKKRVEALIGTAREVYADKELTVAEIRNLVRQIITQANGIVQDVDAIEGDREQLFTDICVACWKDLGEPMRLIPNVSWIPGDWIEKGLENKVVDPAIGNLVEFSAGLVYWALSEEPAAAA